MRDQGSGIRRQVSRFLADFVIIFAIAVVIAIIGVVSCRAQIVNIPTTNSSATITTGNTFQTVLAAVPKNQTQRHSLTIENNNGTDSCWVVFGTGITAGNATKAESIQLLPGGSFSRYYPYVPSDEIEATCTSTSDTLYIDTQ